MSYQSCHIMSCQSGYLTALRRCVGLQPLAGSCALGPDNTCPRYRQPAVAGLPRNLELHIPRCSHGNVKTQVHDDLAKLVKDIVILQTGVQEDRVVLECKGARRLMTRPGPGMWW